MNGKETAAIMNKAGWTPAAFADSLNSTIKHERLATTDFEQDSELLATYSDVVNEIPSLLTTCFSKSPVVSPMWAHYGNNHKGFVVGFDVPQLEKLLPELLVRDISYLDRPSETLVSFAEMAAHRKKPRDAMALRQAVLYHGYFSKYSEWSYEQEVRAVNVDTYVEDVNGNKILYVPKQCVTAIISGSKYSAQTSEFLHAASGDLEAEFYIEKVGLSYPKPYLLDEAGRPFVHTGGEIVPPIAVCEECSEPLRDGGNLCPWCSIDESQRAIAASNNPFRILDHYGLLEQYVEKYPRRPRKPYK